MIRSHALVIGILAIILLAAHPCHAGCGDVDGGGTITANDALAALRAAAGVPGSVVCLCDDCEGSQATRAPGHCADLNGDARTTAQDALAILLAAVGVRPATTCTCDACWQAATTTTSTLPGCTDLAALDGRVFVVKSHCNVTTVACFATLETDTLRFEHLGGGQYAVKRVADDSVVYVGTWDCREFRGTPFVVWEFPEYSRFSGRRPYCNFAGAEVPEIPPDPPRPARCPTPL